ncbi:MAG: WecB/TagA/CpsF family glycosyltransferase [Melioribacteraceae bacterium]
MEFILTLLSSKKILNTLSKQIILYADFNVLNFLFENKIHIDDNVILYPDSTLVTLYLNFTNKSRIKRIVSTDLQQELLNEFAHLHKKIFFFGDNDDTLKLLTNKLLEKNKVINIAGIQNGYDFNTFELIKKLNSLKIDVLFVGLGLSRQEKWIIENYSKVNSMIIISVGGWFQYLAEKKNRAPLFIRKLHLEWIHKLLIEFPRIWKRYFIGIPKFLYRVFTKKIVLHIKRT